jgi:hypothetical protein
VWRSIAARSILGEIETRAASAEPLSQIAARSLIRRLQALTSGWSGPTASADDVDADGEDDATAAGGRNYWRLAYIGADGADAVVAARTDLAERIAAVLTGLLARLTLEMPDDTVTMLRALACCNVLLTQFGAVRDTFAGDRALFPLSVARAVVKDPLGPRWTRGSLASFAARRRRRYAAALDGGIGRATAAQQRLLAGVGDVCSSQYSEVRKSAQVLVFSAAALRPSAARTLVEPLFEQLRRNQDRADSPADEKLRTARVTGALHTLMLLSSVPEVMPMPATRLRLLTFVCTDGNKYDRLQSQARLSSLFQQLLSMHEPVAHPRPTADELGAALDACLRVAQSNESHWRYRTYSCVVLLLFGVLRSTAVCRCR